MNPFEMVVLIVAIIAAAKVIRARHGVVGKDETYVGRAEESLEATHLRAEVQQLRQRIQVLERIVTDGDHNRAVALEREIDALRREQE